MTRFRLAALALTLAACTPAPPTMPSPERVAVPDPGEVHSVVFLVGDPGVARDETHPLMRRIQQDVEWWAERIPTDSAVSVIILGDIIYPLGLHPPGTPQFVGDTAVLMDQVRLVGGPAARARRAQEYLLAGNHDWGLEKERAGFVRLFTLDQFLATARVISGASARLVPAAGTGGPYVLDMGRHARFLLLDTAWWLLEADDEEQRRALERIDEAVRTAGGREVILAAHHPLKTAGPHGGRTSLWRTLGLSYLLTRTGAILQNLGSMPYRRLDLGLREIFARHGVPLLFVGGHEHSLQVIRATERTDPRYILVSGSASKLTEIGTVEGLVFSRTAPGYMRLVIEKDGGMSLFVEAGPEEELVCPAEGPEHAPCMQRGVASIETVHSQRLR